MTLAILLFVLSGDMTGLELSSVAARFARNNWISKGHCARFEFSRAPDIKICRDNQGTPYYCRTAVISGVVGSDHGLYGDTPQNYVEQYRAMNYEFTVCEEFNPI